MNRVLVFQSAEDLKLRDLALAKQRWIVERNSKELNKNSD